MGVLRLGRRVFGAERLLVMAVVDPAAGLERVHAVVTEGADIVDIVDIGGVAGVGGVAGAGGVGVGGASGVGDRREGVAAFVAAVRSRYPDLVIFVSTGGVRKAGAAGADLVSGSGVKVAAEFGAGVVGPLGLAARAVEAGVEPSRIIVVVDSVGELADVVAAGWPALVSVSGQDPARSLATVAVGAWLGARVFRVDQVGETRRALRMVSAIRGDIPPAYAVRGLALELGRPRCRSVVLARRPGRGGWPS